MNQQQDTEIVRMIGDMKGEVGEIRGQLREVIHNLNNLSMRFDGIGQSVITNRALYADIQDIKERLAVLEAADQRRAGAMSLGVMLLKSPIIAWLIGAAALVYALFGKEFEK